VVNDGHTSLPALFEKLSHLIHFSATGWTSWNGFVSEIVAGILRHGFSVKATKVRAIPTSDYPTPAVRPKYSRLSTARVEHLFDFHAEPWEQVVNNVLEQLSLGGSRRC
jgi:dTDP-4-dehydrorhamnose reductase